MSINNIKKHRPYGVVLFLVLGCAPSLQLYNSIPIINIKNQIDHGNKKLEIGRVVGGKFTNNLEGSKKDALILKAVLNDSFKKYNLFLITNYNADYMLNATIMYQDQP